MIKTLQNFECGSWRCIDHNYRNSSAREGIAWMMILMCSGCGQKVVVDGVGATLTKFSQDFEVSYVEMLSGGGGERIQLPQYRGCASGHNEDFVNIEKEVFKRFSAVIPAALPTKTFNASKVSIRIGGAAETMPWDLSTDSITYDPPVKMNVTAPMTVTLQMTKPKPVLIKPGTRKLKL